jgi:hypothetical protein
MPKGHHRFFSLFLSFPFPLPLSCWEQDLANKVESHSQALALDLRDREIELWFCEEASPAGEISDCEKKSRGHGDLSHRSTTKKKSKKKKTML